MTTLLFQLGNVPLVTIKLYPPEDKHPYLSTSIRAVLTGHEARKFAYRTDSATEWQHGKRESLLTYIAEQSGRMVLVRLFTDVK